MARKEVECICGTLWTRSGPGLHTDGVSFVYNGEKHVICEEKTLSDGGIWMKFEKMGTWSSYKGASGTYYMKIIRNLDPPPPPGPPYRHSFGYSDNLDKKVLDMLYSNNSKYDDLDLSTRLFGSPHQLISSADLRVNTKVDLGRKFIENIVAESPIVYFMPGKANFLPNTSDKRKKLLTDFFASNQPSDSEAKDALAAITGNTEERFYDFVGDYATYIRYVNLLCRTAAIYLNIEERVVPGSSNGQKYKYYNWENYKYFNLTKQKDPNNRSVFTVSKNKLKEDLDEMVFGRGNYVPFYVEPNTSFSESASNTTQSSKMESFTDQAEGLSKELAFLMNTGSMDNASKLYGEVGDGLKSIQEKMFGGNNDHFFSKLLGASADIVKGANIIFPEIWGDSAYNKSYSVNINLVSPYGEKEAIYLNIIVPLIHLMCLTLPHQFSVNGYSAPFIVKAFCKGWFSCDMGMVDSIQIDKGGQGDSWTVDGLPTQVKVQLSIKDLYSELMITDAKDPKLFMQNQGMIDFMAVTCGVDITEPTIILKLKTMWNIFTNKIFDIPSNIYNDILQELREVLDKLIHI